MERIVEFIGNHPLLTGALGAAVIALIGYEISRLLRKWRELGTLEAVQLLNREDPVVLDVSNSSDYAKGHIRGALHMPPSRIEAGNQQLLKYRERPVLVYCRNNQVAPQMASKLVKLGFTNVNVLAGGLSQWISDQQPVARHKGSGQPEERKGKGKDKRKNKGKRGKKEQGEQSDEAEMPDQADKSEDAETADRN